jgi:hypothetical protein
MPVKIDTPVAANADPVTSHIAAETVTASGLRKRQCEQVLSALRRHDGATSFELATWEDLDRHMVARRLPDLRSLGLVRNGPARRCAESGRKAVTWIVETQQGSFLQ